MSSSFIVDYKKLFDMAKNNGEQRTLESDLYSIKRFLDTNYDAKIFIEDLAVNKEKQKEFLRESFKASSGIFWQLISFLIDNDEAMLISKISENYTRYLAKEENIEFAELILSEDLPQEDIKKITKKLGENISFKVVVNPNILGGFVVRKIDGTIIDGSLLGRLEQLKRGITK